MFSSRHVKESEIRLGSARGLICIMVRVGDDADRAAWANVHGV